MPTKLPDSIEYGYVRWRAIAGVGDTSDDDRLPDRVAMQGKVTFTPALSVTKELTVNPPTTVVRKPIPCTLNADGDLIDQQGNLGVWLTTGVWKVSYELIGAALSGHDIVVTTSHTEENWLDLTPGSPPGGPVLKPSEYAELIALIASIPTGDEGGTTDHAELTNREAADQHPISSVTGLEDALDGKQPAGNYATNPALTAEVQARQAADSTLSDAIALRQTAEQVDARVQQVVGTAPAALDTLEEIAERLADDADAVSALTSAVAGKADAEHNHDGVYVKPADLPDVSDVVREGDPRLTDDRDPTSHSHSVTDLTATGTPSATTYLRGDGAWATPEGGGTPGIASPGAARWLTPYNILRAGSVSAGQSSPAMYLVTHATDFIGMDIRVEGAADPNPGSMFRLDVYRLSETLDSGTLVASTPETPLTTRGIDLFMTMPISLEPGVYIVHLARNSAADSAVFRSCGQALPTRWGTGTFNETTISDVNGFNVSGVTHIGSPAAEVVTLTGGGYYSGSGPRAILAGFRSR